VKGRKPFFNKKYEFKVFILQMFPFKTLSTAGHMKVVQTVNKVYFFSNSNGQYVGECALGMELLGAIF
jgi:hypothetical protein